MIDCLICRSDSSSVSSVKGGRLPTPKLRELGGIQRTHHDLTTPAVGNRQTSCSSYLTCLFYLKI